MISSRNTLILSFCTAVMLMLSACNVSTANIGSLTTSKDKEGTAPSVSFGPQDVIYATATGNNVPSKVTLKFRTITEHVAGQADNAPIENFDAAVELAGDGVGNYNISPPPTGWPPGKYKIQVTMLLEDGKQQDQKAVSFNVAGN